MTGSVSPIPAGLSGLGGMPLAVAVVAAGAVARRSLATLRVRSRVARLGPARHGASGPALVGWARGGGRAVRSAAERGIARGRGLLHWGTSGTESEHAELLESVARSLRSGASLAMALDQAAEALPGRAAGELDLALRTVRSGAPLPVALDAWARGDDQARMLSGAALALGAELGGARARALDDAASGLRDRAALHREIRALTSQTRSSAAVMVLAPLGFALVSWRADGATARVLSSPTGLVCLAGGLVLDAAGAWWMAALARRVS